MAEYVLAIDNGTTSTRCIAFKKDGTMALDKDGKVIVKQYEYEQIMPQPGWCEHDPIAIWGTAKRTAEEVTEIISKLHGCPGKDKIAALGITNQRETTIVWNKKTGEPIHNGVVWLDTRTEAVVQELQAGGKFTQDRFRAKTGLPIATYFSGLKLKWLIDNVPAISEAGEDALFGTVDTWLLWCITGGPGKGLHMTDVSNASRTMMIDLSKTDASGRPAWDPTLMAVFGAKPSMMPKIVDSSGGEHESGGYGPISGEMPGYAKFGCKGLEGVPVGGMLGDQQAALFGQACYQPGEAKCTYGTGCFLLLNTGDQFTPSSQGLLTTAAYKIKGQPMQYALEGSVAIAGALTQWLRDNLKMIGSAPEVEELANKVEDNGGIYFVPAFSGLYAPYWRPDARGAICGMTRFVNNNHVARAAIEAVCYQACDVFDAMSEDTGEPISTLKVDGGMTANKLLLQFQSDMLACDVSVPVVAETTALGSAYAAGLAVGFWKSKDEMLANWAEKKRVTPQMDAATRQKYSKFWKKAVSKTLDWVELDGEGTKPATAKPGPRQSTFGSTNAMDGAAGALDMKVALMEKKLDAVLDLLKKSAPAA